MDISTVKVEIPDGCNVIIGQTHFIKTAEDLYEIIATSVPQAWAVPESGTARATAT